MSTEDRSNVATPGRRLERAHLLADVILQKTTGTGIAQRAAELRPGLGALVRSGFTDETLGNL